MKTFGVTIGVILSNFPLHPSFEFGFAHHFTALENLQSFMATRSHYTKVVMAPQSPIVYSGEPDLVKKNF
jgi:hypothetical protein